MKLYICTFRVDNHRYMSRTEKGNTEYRLVYAHDEDEAQVKLERALGTDRCEPGDDVLWLRDFEAHEAIV